jgi:hypothetical protein
MSDSISNVRNTPAMVRIRRVRKPSEDRRSDGKEPEPERPESGIDDGENADRASDQDKPLLDEYV